MLILPLKMHVTDNHTHLVHKTEEEALHDVVDVGECQLLANDGGQPVQPKHDDQEAVCELDQFHAEL